MIWQFSFVCNKNSGSIKCAFMDSNPHPLFTGHYCVRCFWWKTLWKLSLSSNLILQKQKALWYDVVFCKAWETQILGVQPASFSLLVFTGTARLRAHSIEMFNSSLIVLSSCLESIVRSQWIVQRHYLLHTRCWCCMTSRSQNRTCRCAVQWFPSWNGPLP